MRQRFDWLGLVCGLLTLGALVGGAAEPSPLESPTHRQTRTIEPTRQGKPIRLNSFCLAPNGTILAACGGHQQSYRVQENGAYQVVQLEEPGSVVVMSPEGEEITFWDLSFDPTAITVAPDGSVFVAGGGRVAHLSAEGQLLAEAATPNVQDLDAFRAQAIEAAKAQQEAFKESYQTQVEELKKNLAELEAVPAEQQAENHTAQVESLKQQVQMYEQMLGQDTAVDPEEAVRSALQVTAIAATANDVFVCCRSLQGYSYDVWRTDHSLGSGTAVLEGLRGCCGQCNIECSGDQLVVAENTKFRVAIYDRDGKRIDSFGRRDRSSRNGFGSCCNPMNVRPLADGQILTAESSIGHIKRFSPEGELVAYIGKAKIGGGCKHCALGFDAKTDRYYMMHQDAGAICVLEPRGAGAEMTDEERLATEARQGLGEKLVGVWRLPGSEEKPASQPEPTAGLAAFVARLFGISSGTSRGPDGNDACTQLTFYPDGKFAASGGIFRQYQAAWTWHCIRQTDNRLSAQLIADQVEFSPLEVEFLDDGKTIEVTINNASLAKVRFERAGDAVAAAEQPRDDAVEFEVERDPAEEE